MFLNICNQEKNVVSLHQKKEKITYYKPFKINGLWILRL